MLGEETRIHFQQDKWIGQKVLAQLYAELYNMAINQKVTVREVLSGIKPLTFNGDLNEDQTRQLCNLIKDISDKLTDSFDTLYWQWEAIQLGGNTQ